MRPPPTDAPDAGRSASAFAQPVGTALLAAAQRGEPAALEQIYRCFERPVYTLALRMCGDRDEAQEAASTDEETAAEKRVTRAAERRRRAS